MRIIIIDSMFFCAAHIELSFGLKHEFGIFNDTLHTYIQYVNEFGSYLLFFAWEI